MINAIYVAHDTKLSNMKRHAQSIGGNLISYQSFVFLVTKNNIFIQVLPYDKAH